MSDDLWLWTDKGECIRYGKKYCNDKCRQKDYNEIRKWKNK